jgi:hypothetical protein
MAIQPGTNKQIPDHAIMDFYNKQNYLGNRYNYVNSDIQFTSTSEQPLFLIKNPAVTASSFPANYISLFCDLRSVLTLTAGANAIIRVYFNPTISSAGTPVTPVNSRIASPNTPVAVATSLPTIAANGKLVDSLSSAAPSRDLSASLLIVDPGNSLLFTVQPSANPTDISYQTSWYEL